MHTSYEIALLYRDAKSKSEAWRLDQQAICCKRVISCSGEVLSMTKTWIQFQKVHDKQDISELTDPVKPECNT